MNESKFEKICRLCLHTTGGMTPIFENNEETYLRELVLKATGIQVQSNDGFPSKLCYRCRYIVELSCELKDMAAKTQTLLMKASSNIVKECLNETVEKPSEIFQPQIITQNSFKESQTKKKPDLKLVLQDDGMMKLLKDEPITPKDVTPGNNIISIMTVEAKNKSMKKEKVTFVPSKLRRKTPPKCLTCQICLTAFTSPEEVDSHVQEHYMDSKLTPYLRLQRPFYCEMCNGKRMSKTQLILHHRRHLNVNPFICKHQGCDFIGKSQDSLRHHVIKHGARSQVCEVCGAAYRRRFELQQHVLRAHRATAAACPLCRKRFRNALTLQSHMSQYHRPGPPRHACDWPGCSKAYPSRGALAIHARTHTDERVFRCHLCAVAAYTSQSMLNRHLRMHERSRMSKCDKCAQTFEEYGAFYRHRITEHGPWLPHRCPGCYKGYQSEVKLQKHVEACERASAAERCDEQTDDNTEPLVTTIEDIMDEDGKVLQLEQSSEDLLHRFRGQSLLVQAGHISDFSKHLKVLQELPPDGLLYIEVDADTEEGAKEWQQ